ncbi:PQQ-binding-like beta-propeller repeat protein [Planctomycetales bacterium ZRK34]|nr:PQQ-binding-like beta-propeller repeat protein [Planctomycetales bacterium ZRK34]
MSSLNGVRGYLQPSVWCFDQSTRKLLWEFETHSTGTICIATDGSDVYVGRQRNTQNYCGNATIWKIDGQTGAQLWAIEAGFPTCLACANGILYAAIDGDVQRINRHTGQIIGELTLEGLIPDVPGNHVDYITPAGGDLILYGLFYYLFPPDTYEVHDMVRVTSGGTLVWGWVTSGMPMTQPRIGTDGRIYTPTSTVLQSNDPDTPTNELIVSSRIGLGIVQDPFLSVADQGDSLFGVLNPSLLRGDYLSEDPPDTFYHVFGMDKDQLIDVDTVGADIGQRADWYQFAADGDFVANDMIVAGSDLVVVGEETVGDFEYAVGRAYGLDPATGVIRWSWSPCGFQALPIFVEPASGFSRVVDLGGGHLVVTGARHTAH